MFQQLSKLLVTTKTLFIVRVIQTFRFATRFSCFRSRPIADIQFALKRKLALASELSCTQRALALERIVRVH